MHEKLIESIQTQLSQLGIDGWLFYGFQDTDPVARRILRFQPQQFASRRWFYLIPAQGEPKKLVHRIESEILDHLPGRKQLYLKWQEFHAGVRSLVQDLTRVAMQYSEKNAIPYVSRVDAGTFELVRSCDVGVVSSGDLIQRFEAVCNQDQIDRHRLTARQLTTIVQGAFRMAADRISANDETTELSIQQFILECFEEEELITDHPPIVAVNDHSANPHYEPTEKNDSRIQSDDFLLIDLWAKQKEPGSIYADITWTGFLGQLVPEKVQRIFEIVRQARDRGVDFLRHRLEERNALSGWEVDDAVRHGIQDAGFGEFFVHRTGHNLGEVVHGNGVHFDNLETHDTRQVIPGLLCTIEPGIYLPGEFGVRSEINVLIGERGPEITTPPQSRIWTPSE